MLVDWLGNPFEVGSRIVYPVKMGWGSGIQMTLAKVLSVRENGLTVEVDRRSRTGFNALHDKRRVTLSLAGLKNLTVLK